MKTVVDFLTYYIEHIDVLDRERVLAEGKVELPAKYQYMGTPVYSRSEKVRDALHALRLEVLEMEHNIATKQPQGYNKDWTYEVKLLAEIVRLLTKYTYPDKAEFERKERKIVLVVRDLTKRLKSQSKNVTQPFAIRESERFMTRHIASLLLLSTSLVMLTLLSNGNRVLPLMFFGVYLLITTNSFFKSYAYEKRNLEKFHLQLALYTIPSEKEKREKILNIDLNSGVTSNVKQLEPKECKLIESVYERVTKKEKVTSLTTIIEEVLSSLPERDWTRLQELLVQLNSLGIQRELEERHIEAINSLAENILVTSVLTGTTTVVTDALELLCDMIEETITEIKQEKTEELLQVTTSIKEYRKQTKKEML